MRVVFLGTGTSYGVPMIACDCAVCRSTDPRDQRMRPSIVVELADGVSVLVDTTPDLRMQALRCGLRRVDAILYTHAHADHVFGLDDVRRFNAINGSPMPVYAAAGTVDEIRARFGYAFSTAKPEAGGRPQLSLWNLGGRFCFGREEIVPVPIMHGRDGILGFRLGGLGYLTDCSGIPESSMALLEGLEVLVLDALRRRPHPTHFSVDQAVEMAGRIGARATYFTHICHDLGHAETCAALPPGMALAYDGLTLEL